ncbi:MAG: SBBP repeat-containing protein [Candidatus Sulfotelmatobacter sp.]
MVDRSWLGTSVVRVRVLAAGLVVLGAGCAVLGWGSRSGQTAAGFVANDSANVTAYPPAMGMAGFETPAAAPATAQELPSMVSAEVKSRARSLFAGLPLIFEPNLGQGRLDPADRRAKFVTRGPGYSLFLGPEGAILSTVSQDGSKPDPKAQKRDASLARVNSLQMKLAGANRNASLTGADLLPVKSNYFLGNDPAKWRRGVPQFARVRYENIYPGINLVFYGNQGRLEYDFQIEPGADPAQAELEFNGAKQLQLKDGALVIRSNGRSNGRSSGGSDGGSVLLQAPRVYQEIAGRRQPVEGRFVLRGANRAGFAIGAYDHSRELVIDPILTFATYFGGSGDERATSIAVDGSFNIYLAGSTTSPNLPAAGVFQTALAAGATQNVYLAKITPPLGQTPAALEYVTYLGGNGTDTPVGIEVDSAGDPYVAGTTSSSNFPTTASNAYQTSPEVPGTHVFVTELLSSAATLQYSSYLSGNGTDVASGMAIDASGYVYVTGTTTSTVVNNTDQFPASTLPEALPFQTLPKASIQFFVTKVNTNAPRIGSIAYSTYFGGGDFIPPLPPPAPQTPTVVGGGIAVDTNGNVYFSGTTNFLYTGSASATDFPILNAYQPCLDIAPIEPIYNPQTCTYPTTTPSASDAFVAKLNPNAPQGEQLLWSTYVGGSGTDSGAGVAVDTGAANVYLVGTTNSIDIRNSETLNNSSAYQLCLDQPINPPSGTPCTAPAGSPPPNDAFVARLSNPTPTTGSVQNNVSLNYLSYLGGSGNETGLAITVDSASGAYVTGWTQSSGAVGSPTAFPVFPTATIQSTLTGAQDAFLARLNTAAQLGQTNGSWATYYAGGSADVGNATVFTEGTGVALDVNQNSYFVGDTNSPNLQVQGQLGAPATGYNGGYDAFAAQLSSALSLSITGVLTLGPNQSFVDAGNQATFTYTITNNGPDQASNITVVDDLSSQITGVALNFVSASASAGTCGGGSTNASVSCSLPTLQSGATATVTIVLTPTPNSAGTQAAFNGGSVQVMGTGNNVLARAQVPAQMGDYTIAINPADYSVPAGQTATYQVVLSPHPVYSSKITLACTGLPTGAACNFTNSPVTLLGPGSSTLNITTTARPINPTTGSLLSRHFYAVWLALPGLTLLGVGAGSNRRRRRILGVLLFCALFAMLLLQPACSGSNTQLPVSGTPAGQYKITVTAVSGSDTKSGVVSLNVQ